MSIIISIIGFIGAWLLFAFPLYQGILDINDQDAIIAKVIRKSHQKKGAFRRNISKFLWLIPPLKIRLERKRSLSILKQSNNDRDFDDIYSLLNQAMAWIYVSFGGVLNGIVATDSLVESFNVEHPILPLILVSLLMIIISIFFISYLISDYRRQKAYKNAHNSLHYFK